MTELKITKEQKQELTAQAAIDIVGSEFISGIRQRPLSLIFEDKRWKFVYPYLNIISEKDGKHVEFNPSSIIHLKRVAVYSISATVLAFVMVAKISAEPKKMNDYEIRQALKKCNQEGGYFVSSSEMVEIIKQKLGV